VSDERAIDAFVAGIGRRDLIEELGRSKWWLASEESVEEIIRMNTRGTTTSATIIEMR
jgi:hypothetical protein